MEYPKLSELNSGNCTAKSIQKHYPEFFEYLHLEYPVLQWSEKLYWFYHKLEDYPKCVCGARTKFINFKKGYREFCGYKCMNKNIQTRREESCMLMYGVKNPMHLKRVKDKLNKTIIERYGVDNVFKSDVIKERIKQSNIIKYGETHPMKTRECKDKMLHTRNDKLIKLNPNILDIDESFIYTIKCPHPDCNKCEKKWFKTPNSIWYDRLRLGTEQCTILSPIGKYTRNTSIELFVRNVLDKYNIVYNTNDRSIIPPKELDIYIPSKRIAIECNGIHWHNSMMKPNNYHKDKFEQCRQQGVQLLTIWEDWIINKPEIVESIILSKLGLCNNKIYARNCVVKMVDVKTSNHFLNENHIQGKSPSKIRLGLYHKDELVSIMIFGARQTMASKNKDEWDLIRFCNKKNCRVVGGASKLLAYFIKYYNPKSIFSFSSNDISDGNLYKQLEFEQSVTNQSYWYIDSKTLKRFHRSSFTKDSIVERGWKSDKNGWIESDVMNEHGYYQVYDSGQTKWVKNCK